MHGRIEFVILRTGCSPPAAPHHASLRRSCIRLQAGERIPEEDFHLSDYMRFQAHLPRPSGRGKATPSAGLSPIQKKKQFLLALAHLPRIETILPFADEFDDLLLRSGFPRFRDTGDDLRSGAKANRNIPFF
jgi:hypothetical protein